MQVLEHLDLHCLQLASPHAHCQLHFNKQASMTDSFTDVNKEQFTLDASAGGCSGMFWRTKPEMNASSQDGDWPRNGTVLSVSLNLVLICAKRLVQLPSRCMFVPRRVGSRWSTLAGCVWTTQRPSGCPFPSMETRWSTSNEARGRGTAAPPAVGIRQAGPRDSSFVSGGMSCIPVAIVAMKGNVLYD